MTFFIGYLICLAVFGILDAIWLTSMAKILYRPTLGNLMLERMRWGPALIFYFGFPVGVMHFVVMPAFGIGSIAMALGNGAFLGLLAYATYDLTNYATLRVWTLKLTLADVAYGTFAVSLMSAIGVWALNLLSSWSMI